MLEIIASGDVGGGTTHVLQILRGFKDRMSLHLVTQRDSYLFQQAGEIGVPCSGLDFFSSRLDLRVPARLKKILRSMRPDVVHVHGGRAAFFLALARNVIPSVYTVHGFHFVYKPIPSRWLAIGAERIALNRASHVIFVSQFDQTLAKRYRLVSDHKPNCVIHNGIPCPSMPVGVQGRQRLIGFVGRLEPQKDPLLFLESVEKLPGYRAVIIGTGSLDTAVRTAIERQRLGNRVTMLGGLSHDDTLHAMNGLQVLVMTSRWEGLPLIPLEAMRIGIPVVATDVGGVREIIENGKSGVLVPERTSTAIALAVERVCEDEALRADLVKEARTRAHDMFSEDTMLSRVRTVYERVTGTSVAEDG